MCGGLKERGLYSEVWLQAEGLIIEGAQKRGRGLIELLRYVQAQVDEDVDITSKTMNARVVCKISSIRLSDVTIFITKISSFETKLVVRYWKQTISATRKSILDLGTMKIVFQHCSGHRLMEDWQRNEYI